MMKNKCFYRIFVTVVAVMQSGVFAMSNNPQLLPDRASISRLLRERARIDIAKGDINVIPHAGKLVQALKSLYKKQEFPIALDFQLDDAAAAALAAASTDPEKTAGILVAVLEVLDQHKVEIDRDGKIIENPDRWYSDRCVFADLLTGDEIALLWNRVGPEVFKLLMRLSTDEEASLDGIYQSARLPLRSTSPAVSVTSTRSEESVSADNNEQGVVQ